MYKAFEEFYRKAKIKHLLLAEHEDMLISPPFATELCKDYSRVAVYNPVVKHVSYIDLNLPAVTSKTNAIATVNDSSWLIPYGIWDEFNTVVELKGITPVYHQLDKLGKGQFYSVASNGTSACSFPLGYQETSFIIYIDDEGLHTVNFESNNKKCHMGTVYCNGQYWSMPRGDFRNYNSLVSYDGTNITKYGINVAPQITRKFTDLIPVGNTLYSLPFGESAGLTAVVEFDTNTWKSRTYELDVPDFGKKYNAQVLLNENIIGLPYGEEYEENSNWGVVFNTVTKQSKRFDIKLNFGGKYRYRCGIAYKGNAIFLPTGSPDCPIISVDENGNFKASKIDSNLIFGRPIIHNDILMSICYNITDSSHTIVEIDEDLNLKEVTKI